jgi:two-component system sensor histidine kinase HydH
MLITAIVAGAALFASSWASYRSAVTLYDTIGEGQGEIYMHAFTERSRPEMGPPSDALLRKLVEDYSTQGLRAVLEVGPGDRVRLVAGTPLSLEGPWPGRGSGRLLRKGDRFRMRLPPPPEGGPPPPRLDEPPGPLGERRGPPREELPFPPPGRPPRPGAPPRLSGEGPLVFEYEGTLSSDMLDRARRTLAVGAGTALLLITVAVLFWRRAQREEALAERLARSERLAALGTMSAVLAHEIKNPIAALLGNAQLVAEGLPEGSHPRVQADRVVAAAQRLGSLVGNLLDFVRGGSVERAPVDPAELLYLAAEDAAPEAELDLDAAPETWSLDAVRMRQVLENLLRNAVQASEGGSVWASVTAEGDRLVYTVRDSGPGFQGVSPETIFEPFFTTKARGLGLGLTVSRRVVEMHGGTIEARNRPEGGAELRVTIPRG